MFNYLLSYFINSKIPSVISSEDDEFVYVDSNFSDTECVSLIEEKTIVKQDNSLIEEKIEIKNPSKSEAILVIIDELYKISQQNKVKYNIQPKYLHPKICKSYNKVKIYGIKQPCKCN